MRAAAKLDLQAGRDLPEMIWPPLTRTTLALYAGGSGDHNPLHLDPAFARRAGLPDVIGHGMLTMALLGRYLTASTPQRALREFEVRFLAMAEVGDAIRCQARVVELALVEGETRATLVLAALNGDGKQLATGQAVVAKP